MAASSHYFMDNSTNDGETYRAHVVGALFGRMDSREGADVHIGNALALGEPLALEDPSAHMVAISPLLTTDSLYRCYGQVTGALWKTLGHLSITIDRLWCRQLYLLILECDTTASASF